MVLVSDKKIIARRPRSLRNRAGEQFLSSLKKSAIDVAAAAASLSPKDIKDAICGMYSNVVAVNLEEAVWLLFNRAMAGAVNDTFSEVSQKSKKMRNVLGDSELIAGVLTQLEVDSFDVAPEFVENPSNTPWVVSSAEKITMWARDNDCPETLLRWLKPLIYYSVPKYMRVEVLTNADDYKRINKETLFDTAVQRSLDWNAYHASIKLEASMPVFNTEIPLKSIYVQPRACSYWVDSDFYPAGEPSALVAAQHFRSMHGAHKRSECLDLHKSLHDWLDFLPNSGSYQERMRIVCGSPGCGKSSFATIFANEVIDRGGLVLLVRLGRLAQFEGKGSLEDILTHYFVNRLRLFRHSPFLGRNPAHQLTLILDGLDELARSDGAG